MFADRESAGTRLADHLADTGIEADVVLGIPRGGLPVARPVADRLGCPLDVIVASKIGAPHNEELAIGAASADGDVWWNDDLIARLDVPEDYREEQRERETAAAREKAERYRDEPVPLDDKAVLIVDDGVATGATALACCRAARAAGAEHIVLAVPVAPQSAVEDLRADDAVDDVIALETPAAFGAVGWYYDRFGQVSDEEAIALLHGEE